MMSKAITPEAARKIIDGIVAERDQAREELARISVLAGPKKVAAVISAMYSSI